MDASSAPYAAWTSRGAAIVIEPWNAPFGRPLAFKDAEGGVMRTYESLSLSA